MSTVNPDASRALAERGGIDPELAIDVLSASAVGSPMLRMRAARCCSIDPTTPGSTSS
ncbi:MAG: hypothetical protein ACRDKY_11790 [Solirubrobacteraceae bacterium]